MMLERVGSSIRRLNAVGITGVYKRALIIHNFQFSSVPNARNDEAPRVVGKVVATPQSSKPKPLSLAPDSPLRVTDPPPAGLSGLALKILGFYSRESQLIRGTRNLYARISAHADNPDLYTTFGLPKTFRTTHAMLLLHVWLTLVRLRAEGQDGSKVSQSLYELFNHNLEQRIVAEGVKMLISKWMKELERNFYGAVEAYDAATQPEAEKDALARALWRNVFAEDDSLMPTGVEAISVKSLTRYVRREAACLAITDSESLLSGNIEYSTDFSSVAVVEISSTPQDEASSNSAERVPA